jgi:hypothetical protein
MNTQTLEKINKLTQDMVKLKRSIKSTKAQIFDIKDTGRFYAEQRVLVFERLLCTNEYPSVDEFSRVLSYFTGLLDNPQYKDGHSVYDGECLLVERKYIDSEKGEDCHVILVDRSELVAWGDYDEDNTYLQVWNDCKPDKNQCNERVAELEVELASLGSSLQSKDRELKIIMKASA